MKRIGILILVVVVNSLGYVIARSQKIGLIPEPLNLEFKSGFFLLDGDVKINTDASINLQFERSQLEKYIKQATGYSLEKEKANGDNRAIELKCTENEDNSEGYRILINQKKIVISASNRTGIFYGIQTLSQIIYNAKQTGDVFHLPCLIISDQPRFSYRALMLDPARHFLPANDIKNYIDVMAMYKFNHLHLHLSDDQGWRVEIEKYPKLNEISSKREETDGNGIPHSGYYTKSELKELVEYAKQRAITIIPEFDIPGHSVAALSAYPEYTCFPGDLVVRTTPGVSNDLFCAGNDKTFDFIRDILFEMAEVFPSEKFHMGGDEAPLNHWKKCAKCQAKIKELNLKDEHGLMSYFFSEVNKSLLELNKKPLFWYELDVPEYPKASTMYAWRGGLSKKAIEKSRKEGYSIVCSPGEHAYFDYPQAKGEETCDWMAYLPLKKVYQFDPGYGLPSTETEHIIGVEATLWGEYIKDIDRAFYMTWPRAMALAEAGWSVMENRNWKSFKKRLVPHLARFEDLQINYRNPHELGKNFKK